MMIINRQSLKFLILFCIIFRVVQSRSKCDTKLMETFSLKGLHYSVASPMHICPQVQDRCCTNMDQLRILKLWNSQGRVTTRMHSANYFQTFIGALKYMENIIPELDEKNIITTFAKHRWIPYIKHYCGQTTELEMDEDEQISRLIPGDAKIQPWDRIVPELEQDKKILEAIDKISTNQYLRIIAHFTAEWEQHFDEMENYYYSEVDLKSIRIKDLFIQGVNFQHEKNYFLYFLQIAANAVIDVFQKTEKHYEGKVKKQKLVAYQETFLQEYKNFMFDAESFMQAYNRLDDPIKRFTELHVYGQVAKQSITQILEGLVIRERGLYLGLDEQKRERQKELKDMEDRENAKKRYQASQDKRGFKNMMSDIRDEHQQYINEYNNGGKGSLNGTTPDEFFTDQFLLQEKKHKPPLPFQKMRKLGTQVLRQQMKEQNIPNRQTASRRKKKGKNKKKKRRGRFRRRKQNTVVIIPDERLDFPSVALSEIIRFRKKAINYALNVQYSKDIFWKNLIQNFVNTRYDFKPKQVPVKLPGKFNFKTNNKKRRRRHYFFDQKQEEYIGKQNRIPNFLFRPIEHPARLKRYISTKRKFKRLESYHASQTFKPFTVNDRLFQVKLVKLPFKSMVPKEFECEVKGRHFYRSLIIQNKQKVEFCYRTIRNLKEEPVDMMLLQLKKQISANINILDLKKSMYCAVCNPDLQYLFHSPKKIIIYEEKFCYNMINMHHEYLTFLHVTVIEFLFNVLQTIQCLKQTGDVKQLPFDTILDKHMRRVQFIKNCLENSEGEDFMRYCYYVCQQINMLGFSDFWDGDVKLIQQIFTQIYNFGTLMEIEPIPEVEQIEYKIPMPLMRDGFKLKHTRGEGYSKKEKKQIEAEQNLIKLKIEQQHILNKTESAESQNTKTPTNAADRLVEPDKQDTYMYKELCKKCPSGDAGINCRIKFCKQPTPCERCPEGPDGTLCREKYCEFYKPFMERYKSKDFDPTTENQPEYVDNDQLIQLRPRTPETEKRFSKVHSRGLQDQNKITTEDTQQNQEKNKTLDNDNIPELKEGRILAFDDDDQSLRKELYRKKLPLYDVYNYRNFFTANRPAINPLKLIKNVKFNQMTPEELFRKQMDQFKNNSIQPEVVKEFLNIDRKEVKAFNKDFKISFAPVVEQGKKHIKKPKALLKKLKHLRYVKNLKKSTVELELHRPVKFKPKIKKMPAYSFILDDIGKNSNDAASKIMLGKVVRIFKDPSDPRDAVKPYLPKAQKRKKSNMNIANQI